MEVVDSWLVWLWLRSAAAKLLLQWWPVHQQEPRTELLVWGMTAKISCLKQPSESGFELFPILSDVRVHWQETENYLGELTIGN